MPDADILFAEIDSIKNFEYPVACTGVCIAPNQRRIITLGTYKPSVRVFDLGSLAMKFERHLAADPLGAVALAEDGEKFAVLRADRCLELHTRGGLHDLVRMPNQPRALLFNPFASELYASGRYDCIYRLSLEQGRFLREIAVPGVVDMALSPKHGLVAGVSEHCVCFVDSRTREPVLSRGCPGAELLSVALHENGMGYAVGAADGTLAEYDIRSEEPVYRMSVGGAAAKLVYSGGHVVCRAAGTLAVCEGGRVEATVEPGFTVNDFDIRGGLLALGGECEKMRCYFSAALGRVPAWCTAAVLR